MNRSLPLLLVAMTAACTPEPPSDVLRVSGHVEATEVRLAPDAGGRVVTLASNQGAVERAVADADLVIGAVLVAGGRAPVVVSETMVRTMKKGAVIVDVAVDQGGCVATTHETTHTDPIYERHGVIHYAVGNMPGAVPYTSTYALTNATLPYVADVAHGLLAADDPALAHGFNCVDGHLTNEAVAEALGRPFVPLATALA